MTSLTAPHAVPSSWGRWLARAMRLLGRSPARSSPRGEADDLHDLLALDARTLRDIGAPEWTIAGAAARREEAEHRIAGLLGGYAPHAPDASRW